MGMNQCPTAALSECLTSWGVAECLLASYLKDHMCSLKINENKPDRPITHIAIAKCRRLPNTATNGKTLFHLTYNFSLQHSRDI